MKKKLCDTRRTRSRRMPEDILKQLMERYPVLGPQEEQIRCAFQQLSACFSAGGKLLLCGNGGSASDCLHIAGELMKSFTADRPVEEETAAALRERYPEEAAYLIARLEGALPAVPLAGSLALTTAFANDAAAELVFAQQVCGLGRAGDALWCLSTSGDAENVRYAAMTAKAQNMRVIGLTGETGGRLFSCCDCCIRVPETETYRVQELHLPVYHALCLMLEAERWDIT